MTSWRRLPNVANIWNVAMLTHPKHVVMTLWELQFNYLLAYSKGTKNRAFLQAVKCIERIYRARCQDCVHYQRLRLYLTDRSTDRK